jgi:hypothetical protein
VFSRRSFGNRFRTITPLIAPCAWSQGFFLSAFFPADPARKAQTMGSTGLEWQAAVMESSLTILRGSHLSSGPMPTTVEEIVTVLRLDYRDAVRLSAREEILAELAEDGVTARLHADTARFHHGSAHAYSRALGLILFFRGEEEKAEQLDVHEAKRWARRATREVDLAPMRCQGRRYRPFDPDPP